MTTPADRVRELEHKNRTLGARNDKLVELLRDSRDQLTLLRQDLEEMTNPPSTYGIFLEPAEGKTYHQDDPIMQTGGPSVAAQSAEVWTGNRRMRLNVLRSLDISDFKPGTLVRLTDGNIIVEDVLEETKEAVQRGEQISNTLTRYPNVFPPLVSSMIAIGEETGAVDSMLDKIAQFYEREVDEAVSSLTAALEPMLIVFLGVIVGFIVAGMFLPMFSIIGTLSG